MMICKKCKAELAEGSNFCNMCGKAVQPIKKTPQKHRPNSTGYVRQRANGKWVAIYPLEAYASEDGKIRRPTITQGGFLTKTEALNYLPSLKARREQIEAEKNNPGKTTQTFDYFLDIYEASAAYKNLSVKKYQQYGYAIAHIRTIGSREITSMSTSELETFCKTKGKTFYPAACIKNVFSHIYKLAYRDDPTITNRTMGIDLKSLSGKDEVPIEPFPLEDVKKFWQAYDAGDPMAPYILLMSYSGMMPGELRIVRKENVHLDVQQILDSGKKNGYRRTEPIILCNEILPVITRLCEGLKDEDLLLQMCEKTFLKRFKQTLKDWDCTALKPYSCRHTTASILAAAGVDGLTIRQIMRQKNIHMTARYIKPDKNTALQAMNAAFAEKKLRENQQ